MYFQPVCPHHLGITVNEEDDHKNTQFKGYSYKFQPDTVIFDAHFEMQLKILGNPYGC